MNFYVENKPGFNLNDTHFHLQSTPFIADRGHPRDRELVSFIARVRNSGNLFQSNVCNLFLLGIELLFVLSGCP